MRFLTNICNISGRAYCYVAGGLVGVWRAAGRRVEQGQSDSRLARMVFRRCLGPFGFPLKIIDICRVTI